MRTHLKHRFHFDFKETNGILSNRIRCFHLLICQKARSNLNIFMGKQRYVNIMRTESDRLNMGLKSHRSYLWRYLTHTRIIIIMNSLLLLYVNAWNGININRKQFMGYSKQEKKQVKAVVIGGLLFVCLLAQGHSKFVIQNEHKLYSELIFYNYREQIYNNKILCGLFLYRQLLILFYIYNLITFYANIIKLINKF